MLNQRTPTANILLERKVYRNKPKESYVVDSSGNNWMAPFAENLGIIPPEFESWRGVVGAQNSRVILVEGDIDKRYFEHFREKYSVAYDIPRDVDIQAYGGKDALKNTQLLKFMISKFEKAFITFDLDAESEIKSVLEKIELVQDRDFIAIGENKEGTKCIEGLLPESIYQQVISAEVDLVRAMGSADTKARKSVSNALKKKLLERTMNSELGMAEMKKFQVMFRTIGRRFSPHFSPGSS